MNSVFKKNALLAFLSFSQTFIFGQVEKNIAIAAPPDSIYGTLLLDTSSKEKILCILHAGSGPTDRNCNSALGLETNAFKKLADSLSKRNFSSFRFDKRGIGESKHALERADSFSIEGYVNDLKNIIDHFSDKKYGFKKIILIGHSEGALISTLAAENNNKVSKLILLAGAGYRADTVIKRQLASVQVDAKKIIYSIMDTLAKGKKVENIPPALSSLFRESVQGYMISWIKYDPSEELAKLKIPVFIVQGGTDIQVSEDDANRLKQHCKDCRMVLIRDMNHILVSAPADKKENKKTYTNPDLPLHILLIPALDSFISGKP